MVMETPSAQCVGREFVRQYYTLLHEAPDYLHRFYSHNSCFVHGGVEKPGEEQPPVMGQANIHKKIMSLKFRDCHAKIRQVDSQPTVANAVVVQVTGELSNNRQPMRRFMQTFLLAPQSPKKYYVHNDIFRYQDEVFHDLEGESDVGADEMLAPDSEQESSDVAGESTQQQASPQQAPQPEPSPATQYYDPEPLSNGTSQLESERPETPEKQPEPIVEPAQEPEPYEAAASKFEEAKEEVQPVVEPEPEPEPQMPQEPQKPKSWAALASQKPQQGGGMPMQQAPKPNPVMQQMKPPMEAPKAPEAKPQAQRAPRPPRGDRPSRDTSRSGENDDQTRRAGGPGGVGGKGQGHPDACQLFVGNLPHNIEEPELKDFFEKDFGKVLEVRINRKSSSTNRDVPNFGFVVFSQAETVSKVLDSRPIMLRGEIRLNVEEKKQRGEQGGRPGSGTRMGRGGGGGGGPGGMMGGRGGGGPPRGGRGGGPGGPPRSERGGGRGGGERGGFGRPR